jgi:CrcB protein
MLLALMVSLAAGAGAVARYGLDQLVQRHTRGEFPLGTLAVNVSGSLVLGLVIGLGLHHGLATEPTLILGSGFAGGYTTLSTWAYETLALAQTGEMLQAAGNVVATVVLSVAAGAAGLALALT